MKLMRLLDKTAINRLKRCVALQLPEMRPSHRVEFVARGLGYQTYAALLSALNKGPILIGPFDLESAIEFAKRVGVDVDQDDVCEVLSEVLDLDSYE
ncbi:hypothetical protein [Thioclava sp.]|uniref:hypothetical protein n=1 Tax=Thioclava sp. TaxID=1933450 RepID=UPI003AA92667